MPTEHCRSVDIGTSSADRHVGVRAAVANLRRFDCPMNVCHEPSSAGTFPFFHRRETHPTSRAGRTSLIPARRAIPRLAISVADAQASGASKARFPMVEEYPAQTSSTSIPARRARRVSICTNTVLAQPFKSLLRERLLPLDRNLPKPFSSTMVPQRCFRAMEIARSQTAASVSRTSSEVAGHSDRRNTQSFLR